MLLRQGDHIAQPPNARQVSQFDRLRAAHDEAAASMFGSKRTATLVKIVKAFPALHVEHQQQALALIEREAANDFARTRSEGLRALGAVYKHLPEVHRLRVEETIASGVAFQFPDPATVDFAGSSAWDRYDALIELNVEVSAAAMDALVQASPQIPEARRDLLILRLTGENTSGYLEANRLPLRLSAGPDGPIADSAHHMVLTNQARDVVPTTLSGLATMAVSSGRRAQALVVHRLIAESLQPTGRVVKSMQAEALRLLGSTLGSLKDAGLRHATLTYLVDAADGTGVVPMVQARPGRPDRSGSPELAESPLPGDRQIAARRIDAIGGVAAAYVGLSGDDKTLAAACLKRASNSRSEPVREAARKAVTTIPRSAGRLDLS